MNLRKDMESLLRKFIQLCLSSTDKYKHLKWLKSKTIQIE